MILLTALVVDAVFGDPPNKIHPLRWIGNMVGFLDRHITRRRSAGTKAKGFLSFLLVTIIYALISIAISALTREFFGEIAWIIVSGILLKFNFAIFSFRKHCKPIFNDLSEGRTEDAAKKTQMIVSRNTKGMDPEHISSSCVETVSENFADSVCSPLFFFGIFGIFGAILFRCTNLMDAMWGYRNEKYGDLGYFAAKFDDILGYVTSRLSILFIALAAFLMRMNARAAISTAFKENDKTQSPNSGWPMAAVAGAMGVMMEKKNEYTIGTGNLPTVDDIKRSYKLVELSSILFILILAIPLYAIIGVHVQVFMEGLLLGVFI